MTFVTAQPVLDFVAERGGVENLTTMAGLREMNPETGKVTVLRTKTERDLIDRAHKMLTNARKQGRFTFHAVDDFCIEVLGVHPFEVYGSEWFQLLAAEVKANSRRKSRWDDGLDDEEFLGDERVAA